MGFELQLHFFEILAITAFVLCVVHSKRNWGASKTLVFFPSVVFFSWFLEEMGVLFWGVYVYNPAFWLFVGVTPVAITLGWAAVIYASIILTHGSSHSGVPTAVLSASYALSIDLGMDVPAYLAKINGLGFWEWFHSTSSSNPYVRLGSYPNLFGVPLANYIGWFFYVMWFTILFHWLDRKNWSVARKTVLGIVLALPVYGISMIFIALGVTLVTAIA